MSRLDRLTYNAGVVLILGGLLALGAFAGVRVAFGLATQTLECGVLAADTGCLELLRRLNQVGETFVVGGVVAMACGFVAVWSVRRRLRQPAGDDAASETGDPA